MYISRLSQCEFHGKETGPFCTKSPPRYRHGPQFIFSASAQTKPSNGAQGGHSLQLHQAEFRDTQGDSGPGSQRISKVHRRISASAQQHTIANLHTAEVIGNSGPLPTIPWTFSRQAESEALLVSRHPALRPGHRSICRNALSSGQSHGSEVSAEGCCVAFHSRAAVDGINISASSGRGRVA